MHATDADDDRTDEQTALHQPPTPSSTVDVHRVASYGDLIKHPALDVQTADAVAYELESGAEFVAWVPEWLIDSKPAASSDHHAQVVAGNIETATEKAVLVTTSSGEAWLPKSQIHAFERADGAALTIVGVHDEAMGE